MRQTNPNQEYFTISINHMLFSPSTISVIVFSLIVLFDLFSMKLHTPISTTNAMMKTHSQINFPIIFLPNKQLFKLARPHRHIQCSTVISIHDYPVIQCIFFAYLCGLKTFLLITLLIHGVNLKCAKYLKSIDCRALKGEGKF